MLGHRSTVRGPRVFHSAFALVALATACAAPRAEPLRDSAILDALELRVADPSTLESALELARAAPLPFELPDAAALREPADPLHVRARVLAYAPAVRAARRAWLAAAAVDRTGASSAPLGLGAELVDPPDADGELEVELTFDLLGLLGGGRASAARRVATAEQRRALGELWSAAWSSLHAAERARIRVFAAHERVAALDALVRDALQDRARLELLEQRGYARPDQAQWAWAILGEVEARRAQEALALAEAESEFATAVGLALEPARAWLDAHGANARVIASTDALTSVEASGGDRADARAESQLANHPRLLTDRLDYALALARIDAAASELVPELRVGPKPHVSSDDIAPGGLIALELAWPPAVRARVRALEHARDAARERLEDDLLALRNELAARETALRVERDERLSRALAIDRGAAAMWSTARARFANATDALEEWSFALEHRVEPLLTPLRAREAVALAELACSEAFGSADIGTSALAARAREDQR